jgi:capsule biosynthesis phosphatase
MAKTVVSDLDGTLCEQTPGGEEYFSAKPIPEMIAKLNQFYDAGYDVIIYTARGMNLYNGNLVMIEHMYRNRTARWLKDNGVKYHKLQFGKPAGHYYVDDKGVSPSEFLRMDV